VIASVLLTVSMFLTPLPVAPEPQIATIEQAAAQAEQAQAREWAASRPQRGNSRTAVVVERAATFPAPIRSWAACVLERESGGSLHERQSGSGAMNTEGSGAQGRWQFLQSWNHGGPYMVRDRLVQFGLSPAQAREIREYLSGRPISQWHGYWQDILFIEVNERGGSFHWDGPGC